MKELYTTKELAHNLKVHINTIVNFRKEGMPCRYIGKSVRFDADEVNEWLEQRNKEEVK